MLYTVIQGGATLKIILINGTSVPLYEQIKNAIKEGIVNKSIAYDEQLPSVRQLSKELSISILTVKKAYDELEKEGLISIRQGVGTFVSSLNSSLIKEERQKEMEINLINACKIAKIIDFSKEEFLELAEYIYEGDMEDE